MKPRSSTHGEKPEEVLVQQRLMTILALIAGFCDSYGLIHFKTYVSFMSGNTTQAGFALGQSDLPGAYLALTAISLFAAGIFAATIFSGRKWYNRRWIPYAIVATLLALGSLLVDFTKAKNYEEVALLSFALGYMNSTLTQVGSESVNADFVTGNLSKTMQHLAFALEKKPMINAAGKWDTHWYRAKLLIAVWICFLSGAFLCVFVAGSLGKFILLPPILALLLCPAFLRKYRSIGH